MRIYSNYSSKDYDLIKKEADRLGFTPSALQSYALMLFVMNDSGNRNNSTSVAILQNKMITELEKMEKGKTFIVSSLLPDEWPNLTRNEKMTLAKTLSNYINKHTTLFSVEEKKAGKPKIYKKYR